MVKVRFVELDQEKLWAVTCIGTAFFNAYLRVHVYDVCMFRVPLEMSTDYGIDQLKDEKPYIIGVSLISCQWLRAKKLIPVLRQKLDVILIACGLHTTFESDLMLETRGFDYVCIGEGEQAMLEVVQGFDLGYLPSKKMMNIREKADSMPELRDPFESFDKLPYVARDTLHEQPGIIVQVEIERGCRFRYSYCTWHS